VEARAADDALLLPEDRARFTVRLPTEVAVAVGEPLALSINPERLYFFDPDSGDTLT
jgi:multiple sugar transport system ATP-binding protein